ncbi:TIGR00645 family protein [Brevibacterium sp. 91QC2O2]|uniref:TIGR00645 family protein n=1 Tax=Brevibacterium sp. 91QC2O2 TaxID=2968458 RepID=UPI00211BE633|nr:TIGR00645 family protein [Brevibacterium sp. 91QC2O2]
MSDNQPTEPQPTDPDQVPAPKPPETPASSFTHTPTVMSDGNYDFSNYRRSAGSRQMGLFIFSSRWLQAPLYIGLAIALLIYAIVFLVDLWHLIVNVSQNLNHLDEDAIMLSVLGLIDVVMIANLLIMVIMGGYDIFVSKLGVDDHPDEPDWLHHINANVLKVKLAISIISISSIHLLSTFIKAGNLGKEGSAYTMEGIIAQVVIHLAFIISAVALQWIDSKSHAGNGGGKKHPRR